MIVQALMVPLGVVVSDVLSDGSSQCIFAKEDHPIQAFLLDRFHEAFGEGVEIWRTRR